VSVSPGDLCYRCNICGLVSTVRLAELHRERRSCPNPACGSTPRFRSIVHMLSTELFGTSIPLPSFPYRKDLRGIGMSDWIGYAGPLAERLSFVNTYYHTDPHLDITSIEGWDQGVYDFIISSEVFEHVAPPVSRGFENCRRLLKPGGVLILTTPYRAQPGLRTREHFPDLFDYMILDIGADKHRVINRTQSGQVQTFDDLVFHEGPGVALEMRVFSEESLLADLGAAGFTEIRTLREPNFEHGVYWPGADSWPISARA
jgi:SAM-dependent methyltransferase